MTTPRPQPVGTASVSWIDTNDIAQLHVYSTDGYNITERYWAGSGWTTGGFTAQGGQVSPVNSSYNDRRGVCAIALTPTIIKAEKSKFFFMVIDLFMFLAS